MAMTMLGTGGQAALRAGQRPVRHPDVYCWILLLAALDVICTWVVLSVGGSEVNGVARWAIEHGGHWGLIGLKFTSVTVVLTICEVIAMRRPRVARRLAIAAAGISAVPVAVALVQLAGATWGGVWVMGA